MDGADAGIRGHVVLGMADGRRAVWISTPTGEPTGAWVVDEDSGEESARALLTVIERRAIAGWDRDRDLAVLGGFAAAAGVKVPDAYGTHWIDLRRLHQESAQVRASLAEAVGTHRGAPLTYTYEIPDLVELADLDAALERFGMVIPRDGEPAAVEAIGLTRLLRAHWRIWEDTESARLRRTYQRDAAYGGPVARVLPPAWHEHLVAVDAVPFEL